MYFQISIIWFFFERITLLAADVKVCSEESTNEKNPVMWPNVINSAKKVESNPMCLSKNLELVSRTCSSLGWLPQHDAVPQCSSTMNRPPRQLCPPGFDPIVDENEEIQFCYQLNDAFSWDYPCFTSGSSLTVFDLNAKDLKKLLNAINLEENVYFWLPAKRTIPYGPIQWTVPGEKWKEAVELDDEIKFTKSSVIHNCLLLNLDRLTVKTDNCSYQYPSLCITEKEHLLPLHCPVGYETSKNGLTDGKCYGLEITESDDALTWNQFIETRCPQPMMINNPDENFIIYELSKKYDFDDDELCWIGLMQQENEYTWYPNYTSSFVNWDSQANFDRNPNISLKGVINQKHNWLLIDDETKLNCMVCEIKVNCEFPDISLQDNYDDTILLTIYNQKSLWKIEDEDIGVECFSNADGFIKRISIKSEPYRKAWLSTVSPKKSACPIEKSVYKLKRINDDVGEYWCEGHFSKNFQLITSEKLLLSTKDLDYHVFVLQVILNNICNDLSVCNPDWQKEEDKIKSIIKTKTVKIMAVDNIHSNFSANVVLHINVILIKLDVCQEIYCRMLVTYNFLLKNFKFLLPQGGKYEFVSLKSTEYCLPGDENDSLNWELTRIGENTAPREFCMQSNGLPVTRHCLGTFLLGGYWESVQGNCSENFEPTKRTAFLYSVSKGRTDVNTTCTFLVHDLISLLDNKVDIIPADIYFLAMSLKTIIQLSNINSSLIEFGNSSNIATAINSIMDIEESYLSLAQTMNSSNMLLESVDLILSKIAANETDQNFNTKGIDIAITSQFIIQISVPNINNISGLAIIRKPNINSNSFLDHDIIQLTANMTVKDVLAIPNLEVATWMSQELLDNMKLMNRSLNGTTSYATTKPLIIIIEVYYKDVVFQETKEHKDRVNSRVISVTVPNYESDLPLPLPLIYRRLHKNDSVETSCAYWDFKAIHTSFGQWSKRGCYYISRHDDLDECSCFHLTHFAQLVLGHKGSGGNTGEVVILYYHRRALNTITLVGCSLSMVGVAGIAATAILFPTWRQKAGSKILLQLSAAIALQSIMMMSQDIIHESDIHCIVLGVLLHYSVLAAFMWMLLTALLQFARYVRVLGVQRPARFMVKFSLLGWGLPILPVVILLSIDYNAYLPAGTLPATISNTTNITNITNLEPRRDPTALCYPQGLALYLTVLFPVAFIVITNLVVFILVIRSITRGPDGKRRSSDPEMVISQLRLSLLLFFLLGLSWIFGLLAATGGMILFSYLFCLTATLQGFVLFVYFVVCDPATRTLWVSLVREKSKTIRSSTNEISG